MPYATVNDVQTRFGRTLTTSETAQAEAWIGDIEAQIAQRIPTLEDQITAGNPTTAVVKAVVSNAVIRVLRNPEGLRQRQFSIDDYSESATVDVALSAGLLYLTDDEWNLLSPGSSGDAFTIRAYGAADREGEWIHPDMWVPLP